MDSARARLMRALKLVDPHDRLRMYHPVTDRGRPIYVHAKILIVDDTVIRVGSSNFNNRSLRLDTECDVTIDANLPGETSAIERIVEIRDELLAEHLGVAPAEVAEAIAGHKSMIAAIEALRGSGKTLVAVPAAAARPVPDLAGGERSARPGEPRGNVRAARPAQGAAQRAWPALSPDAAQCAHPAASLLWTALGPPS